jgi:hypothetical protein
MFVLFVRMHFTLKYRFTFTRFFYYSFKNNASLSSVHSISDTTISFTLNLNDDMKRYSFVFGILVAFAAVACDSSSKATTAQLASAPPPQTIAAPIVAAADTAVKLMPQKKVLSKKGMKAEQLEMAPLDKTKAGVPAKN